MSNFIDFNERLTKLRVDLMKATDELMKTDQPPFTSIQVGDEGMAISTVDGAKDVETIFYDFLTVNKGVVDLSSVSVKTTDGEIMDYSDLDTDDMVAIYEHIWYQLKEK